MITVVLVAVNKESSTSLLCFVITVRAEVVVVGSSNVIASKY